MAKGIDGKLRRIRKKNKRRNAAFGYFLDIKLLANDILLVIIFQKIQIRSYKFEGDKNSLFINHRMIM